MCALLSCVWDMLGSPTTRPGGVAAVLFPTCRCGGEMPPGLLQGLFMWQNRGLCCCVVSGWAVPFLDVQLCTQVRASTLGVCVCACVYETERDFQPKNNYLFLQPLPLLGNRDPFVLSAGRGVCLFT